MKRAVLVLAALMALPLMLCAGLGANIALSFPASQGARIDASGVIGVETDGSYAWVLETRSGVVLIDAGMDVEAKALKAVIADRPVQAVFVTHGHLDHVAGLAGLDAEAIYCGVGEAGIARGEVGSGSVMASIFGALMGYPPQKPVLHEVRDGQVVMIEGERFTAVHLPGHTRGSTAWVHDGVAFTGDAALGHGDHIAPVHWVFSEDNAQAHASLSRLDGLGLTHLADGHAGWHPWP